MGVLKQSVQNFARREAASFLQCGMLHLLLVFVFVSIMAASGELKRGRYLGRNGYGNSCGITCLTMTRFLKHRACLVFWAESANIGTFAIRGTVTSCFFLLLKCLLLFEFVFFIFKHN